MIERIVFFNFLHNGDLHVSRSLVKSIISRLKLIGINKFEYQHKNNLEILKDLDIKMSRPEKHLFMNKPTHVRNNTLYINTWYNSDREIFKQSGVSFDTLYFSFQRILNKHFNIDISSNNLWDVFPEINYNKFDINKARRFLRENKNRRKIFVSNGRSLSGQSINFDISQVINRLSYKYSDYLFLVSNDDNKICLNKNIIFTKSIIGKSGCDLNENGFLSTHCDAIVGRYSGAYTFAMTKYNYQRNVKFISFCNYCNPSWIKALPMDFKAKFISSKSSIPNKVFNIINEEI